jgi:hypothetical protein
VQQGENLLQALLRHTLAILHNGVDRDGQAVKQG